MFEVGTQVEYDGQSYQIISSRINPTGRRMYMLKSLTSDSRVGAFEEDLSAGSSVRTAGTRTRADYPKRTNRKARCNNPA